MIWDRLFGSFVPEQSEEPVCYGLVKNLATFNPIRIALHEYVGLVRDQLHPGLTLRERLSYVLGPPGWRHDGHGETTEGLRAKETTRRARMIEGTL